MTPAPRLRMLQEGAASSHTSIGKESANGRRHRMSKRRLTFWFASCSFKFLISISISSTSLAARRSFSRLVCVTCALSLLCVRAFESD